jgi:hypothetical protein
MAAGPTYEPIASVTIAGSSTAAVTFGNGNTLPQTYTDLIVVINATVNTGTPDVSWRFNNDTGSNYSRTYLVGDSGGAGSGRNSSGTAGLFNALSTSQSVNIIQIMNYSNSTTYKTVLTRNNQATTYTSSIVGLWRSTAAITEIDLTIPSGNFVAGSTFTLYGIAAA